MRHTVSTYLIMFIIVVSLGTHISRAQLLMRNEGQVCLAPYIHGVDKSNGLYPGYRAAFSLNIDIYRWDNLYITGFAENTTLISRTDTTLVDLDKIHYVLSPGFRYNFEEFYLKGGIHHESINNLDQNEDIGGAFWFNSIRLGIGSKGSSFLYLPETYMMVNNRMLNSFDGHFNIGYFIHGKESIWTAKKHHYQYETFGNLRYHIGIYKKWAAFVTLSQQTWIKKNDTVENKIRISLSMFHKGEVNFSGFYYSYVIHDTYSKDNEDKLGSIGYRIIF